jgi:hypothetical protein
MPLITPDGKVEEKKVLKTGRIASQTLLKGLFVSQVRVDILKLFLLRPGKEYHVRGITRRVNTEINAVRRELENLVSLGLFKKTPRRNRLYYSVKQDFPFFNEVLGMVVKESGLGKKLSRGSKSLGDVKLAFFSIPYLTGRVAGPDDIDLLIVGRVAANKIAELVKKEEKRMGHEINYSILSEGDFAALKKRRDSFLLAAIFQPKVILTPHSEQYLSAG